MLSTSAYLILMIVVTSTIVSWLIVWRLGQKINRAMRITSYRINRMESDTIALKARVGTVENITSQHAKQICKLNRAVFDKDPQNSNNNK